MAARNPRQAAVARLAGPAALWLALALAAAPARAQGLRRLEGGWLVPERLATGALRAEAGRPGDGLWARAGQARLYGLPELPLLRLAVGASGGGGAWACEGAWEALGSSPVRDDVAEVRLSAGGRWRAGLAAQWRRVQAGEGPVWRTFSAALDLGLDWRGGPLGNVSARFAWPVAEAGPREPGSGPDRRLLVAVAGAGRALALAVDTDPDGRPHAGWEALCALAPGVGLSWRADPASGALGGGLRLQRGRLRLRTSHLAHPDLGVTHRCELAIGAAGASPW